MTGDNANINRVEILIFFVAIRCFWSLHDTSKYTIMQRVVVLTASIFNADLSCYAAINAWAFFSRQILELRATAYKNMNPIPVMARDVWESWLRCFSHREGSSKGTVIISIRLPSASSSPTSICHYILWQLILFVKKYLTKTITFVLWSISDFRPIPWSVLAWWVQ